MVIQEIIDETIKKNEVLVKSKLNSLNFKTDIEGKRILNTEISKIYNNPKLTEKEFHDIVITSHIVIKKLNQFKNCGWTPHELNSQLSNGVERYLSNISSANFTSKNKGKLINATAIGQHFNISSQRTNLVLSELGWIEKKVTGWPITKLGINVGGKQFEHESSGSLYVLWPENILQNKSLLEVFNEKSNEKPSNSNPTKEPSIANTKETNLQKANSDFRDKFEAKHRTKDGHYVRSRAEVIIDNALYDYGLVHAYEKKVPIEEELYTDFYLPNSKVYIEYWGLEDDPKYAERKNRKKEIYKKYDLNLIELDDSDISNLDDHLPKKLLKFGIKVY